MSIRKQEKLRSINDVGLCLKTLIYNRFNKKTKIIYTEGKYKSLYVSFYRNRMWQFYVQDKNGLYNIYLIKDDKVIKKDYIRREETVANFYIKIMYMFRLI